MSNGAVREEEFREAFSGIVVTSSIAELRRRLWFDETHDAQADAIAPRRRGFFVDCVNVVTGSAAIAGEDDFNRVVVVVVFVVFRGFRAELAGDEREERLGVELFRCVYAVVEVCSTDGACDECFLSPQHRNGKEWVVDEEETIGEDFDDRDRTCFFRSRRNGRIEATKKSEDDDDRVIEMTGGGGLLVTLVIDFYANDDDDNDEEPRIGIHERNDESSVACCWRATHTHAGGRVSLSLPLALAFSRLCLSLSLSVTIAATAAACFWWWWWWWWCEARRAMTMFLVAVAPSETLQ